MNLFSFIIHEKMERAEKTVTVQFPATDTHLRRLDIPCGQSGKRGHNVLLLVLESALATTLERIEEVIGSHKEIVVS